MNILLGAAMLGGVAVFVIWDAYRIRQRKELENDMLEWLRKQLGY